MQKYEGLLIHQEQDEQGLIEIVEKNGVRALHFGSSSQQSSLSLTKHNELHARYARAMMAWMLFKERPENVLMIGLGGGVIAKYMLYHFDNCQMKVIEFRQAMLKVARRFFGLPLHRNLKVKIADGADYINQQTTPAQHDLIFIDAFDAEGMSEIVQGLDFFKRCKELLSADGILVINLWGSQNENFKQLVNEIGITFEWRVLFLPVRKRGNIIALAFPADFPAVSMKTIRRRAKYLDSQYQIEFLDFIKDLKRNNGVTLNKVITE